MDILVPSTSKRLSITQSMVEDFILDPVAAAKVIMGFDLDAFQRCRLKYYWHIPMVIDSSGFSTGKTLCGWLFMNLRALIIPNHVGIVYYQTMQAMKNNFFKYYDQVFHPIFRAQLGKIEAIEEQKHHATKGKSEWREPACWKVFFKNGSQVHCPAAAFATKSLNQAGSRGNDAYFDEWTKSEVMTKAGSGIDEQLIGRITMECFNQNHPFWRNHMVFSATAEDSSHPAYARIRAYQRFIKRGDTNHALITFSFKDYSDLDNNHGKTYKTHRDNQTINEMREKRMTNELLEEAFGIWSKRGKGLYTGEMFVNAQELGQRKGLTCSISKADDIANNGGTGESHYFLGIDPAPAQTGSADDGALVVFRATENARQDRVVNRRDSDDDSGAPQNKQPSDFSICPVYAYLARGFSMRQWAGLVHKLHNGFAFSNICLDHGPGGGGGFLKVELSRSRQLIDGMERECRPIATSEDVTVVNANFILNMFHPSDLAIQSIWPDAHRGGDVLKDCAHTELCQALDHRLITMPSPDTMAEMALRGTMASWPQDKQDAFKLLVKTIPDQFFNISVATKEDGRTLALTTHNARIFNSKGKDDLVMAYLMAYTAFIMWLKRGDVFFSEESEDSDGFSL